MAVLPWGDASCGPVWCPPWQYCHIALTACYQHLTIISLERLRMENGTTWGTWLAYVAIVAFLVFLFALFVRTMALFLPLTFMPLARMGRWFLRLIGRGEP